MTAAVDALGFDGGTPSGTASRRRRPCRSDASGPRRSLNGGEPGHGNGAALGELSRPARDAVALSRCTPRRLQTSPLNAAAGDCELPATVQDIIRPGRPADRHVFGGPSTTRAVAGRRLPTTPA